MARQEREDAPQDRREGMRRAARRRAEHYAYFQEPAPENVHVGGDNARTLGPWSSARQLVDERERARAAREDQIKKRKVEEEVLNPWKPRARPDKKIQNVKALPSLFELALQVLCDHFDAVESLEGIPDVVRAPIATELSRRRALTPQALPALVAGYPTEVVLSNCTLLDQSSMVGAFKKMGISRMNRIELQFCGRGFGDSAVEAILQQDDCSHQGAEKHGTMLALDTIFLSGAYRLTYKGLQALLRSSPSLKSLKLESCTRLAEGGSTCLNELNSIAETLETLSLRYCAMNDNNLLRVIPKLKRLSHLELDGQDGITDVLICEVAALLPLRSLHLSGCCGVTDAGLVAVSSFCPELQSIRLDGMPGITDKALEALAEGCKGLKKISIRQCTGVSASGISRIVSNGGITELNVAGIPSVNSKLIQHLAATCSGSLVSLDLSWCRAVHEDAVGHLVDSCSLLEELALFGCSQITHRLLHGHSNPRVEIHGC